MAAPKNTTLFCLTFMWSIIFFAFIFQHSSAQPRHRDLILARDSRIYNGVEMLDMDRKYILEWVVNWSRKSILFNVTVETKGYVGFGLSSQGRMQNADIVIGGVRPDGSAYFTDRHGIGNSQPIIDSSQDWHLLLARENFTHTFLSFSRAFDTCDGDDYILNEWDTVNIIWAIGETDDSSVYHSRNRGSYSIYLLNPNLVPKAIKESTFTPGPPSSEVLTRENLRLWSLPIRQRVPPRDTHYLCTMHQAPHLGRKHHLVGFNFRLETEDARQRVHHLLMYKCMAPPNMNAQQLFGPFVNGSGEECYNLGTHEGPMPIPFCLEVFTGYAIGGRIAFLPDHFGVPFGENWFEYYMVQVHYDNPELRSDMVLDVITDIYYTDRLRPFDGGVLSIGDTVPSSPSTLIPPKSTQHNVYSHCSKECIRTMLPVEGINLSFLNLHTHISGRASRLRHFRGRRELPWVVNDDNYQNTFQTFRSLNNEVHVRPGDHLMIRCVYDNTWANGTIVGGFRTSHEMCISFVYYYNKINGYAGCRSRIEDSQYMEHYLGVTNITWDNSQLEYVATAPAHLTGMTMTQISDRVPWTTQLRSELEHDHRNLPQLSSCPRLGSLPPSGLIESSYATYPDKVKEYIPPPRTCKRQAESNNNDQKTDFVGQGWGRG